ncbi:MULTISPECIES: hypothetical protein [Streptomyces]|uniref:Uncharacterized protein n=1 Tax=Streptomyces fradiae ATCC 10745 = DSM 40063 TaxID=1319510 RepID=A0A1Y2P4Q8_STRFR|nr:hypothetical protein [Streptomyces sp. NRRL WC-3719]KAF0649819.1 hypothetical protein K701_10525 [Streptomyces fradiae ATCC 10745 = DSM 40063]OSY54207.1 hypothetical protein BG846_00101 [Streptomyces fradiae ATCC 10745 = DSM 40063]QEV14879.1 hypothetical protein CP974_26195 [Streptomyces fradiae ATCC 10745 = DSM 40063]
MSPYHGHPVAGPRVLDREAGQALTASGPRQRPPALARQAVAGALPRGAGGLHPVGPFGHDGQVGLATAFTSSL